MNVFKPASCYAGNGTLVVLSKHSQKHHVMNLKAGDVVTSSASCISKAAWREAMHSSQSLLQCVLSDDVEHYSLPNESLRSRDVWMPQYSAGPILWKKDDSPFALAVPLEGERPAVVAEAS